MNPEHRKRVTADQQPDPDSTMPLAKASTPRLAVSQRACQLSTDATAEAAAIEYASRLCGRAAGRRHDGCRGRESV